MSQLHIGQIETHLRKTYFNEFWDSKLQDHTNLSRLLARWAIDLSFENSADGSMIVEISDGSGDRGIDAVGVDPVSSQVTLVQSKWRQDGKGSIDLAGVLKFLDGVRSLLDLGSEGPSGCSEIVREAVRNALITPGARLKMILATTATNELSLEVRKPIDDLLETLNDVSEDNPIAKMEIYLQAVLYDALTKKPTGKIDLDMMICDWGKTSEPVLAYYGRVNALQVANWYEDHDAGLFAENIRVVLPKSEINDGILRTIREEPDHFWYYNNGITMLARKIEKSLGGAATRDAGFFKAFDASIVNGAQTASTLARALKEKDGKDNLEKAYVNVRIIEVPEDNQDIGMKVSRFANTQNEVLTEDFVWLDENQHRIVKEMRLQGYEYIIRSGEIPTIKDTQKVIRAKEAGISLACASGQISHAVAAKKEVSKLFEGSIYKSIFNPTTNALSIIRAVDALRIIDQTLASELKKADGIRAGIAIHGSRVIAHLVFSQCNPNQLSDPSYDFDKLIKGVSSSTVDWLDRLVKAFPKAYPGNMFKNESRCRSLIASMVKGNK